MKLNPIYHIVIFILVLLPLVSKADQLAYITKNQAAKTVKYLKNNKVKEIVLFCGCCEKDVKKKISITNVFYRYTNYENYYEVVIEGYDDTGHSYTESLDLAYVHIRTGNVWSCLGRMMRFKCDPCTDPFML